MNLDPLHYVVLLPALGGLICYLLGRRAAPVSRVVALVGTAGALGVMGAVSLDILPHHTGTIFWLEVGGFELTVHFVANAFTGWLTLAATGFGLLIVLYSTSFCAGRVNEGRYYGFVLWSVAGAAGALLADNLLLLLIAWEVVTLMLYLLVGLGPAEGGRKSAAKSFTLLGLSDCALLLGIVFIWSQTRTLSIQSIAGGSIVPVDAVMVVAFFLMVVGALAKAGAMPLHTWVPSAAEAAPTPVMALLPAALDKLLGIYLLAVVCYRLFDLAAAPAALKIILMLIGAATILGAVCMAMIQHDLKKLLSFHAISQVGYMVLGIGTGIPLAIAGGLFHMINHATYKCCLFLGAGSVERETGTTEIEKLGGLARAMPVTFVAMTIAALSISGVPPFNGFASKWLVYQGVLQLKSPLAPLLVTAAVFGSALTLASFVKVLYGMFLGRRPEELAERHITEAPATMWVPMMLLAAVCVFFGIAAVWPAGNLLAPALAELGVVPTAAEGRLTLAWTTHAMSTATVLLVLGLALGALVVWLGRTLKVREVDVFLGGDPGYVPAEKHRVPATGFYETVRKLPGLAGAYDHAEQGAFDAYHVGGSYGIGVVEGLRRLHTGLLPLYVGWCALGLGVILAVILALS
jgi:formate hydrogenlyase subunit 3/multisubunit Na+/H+ antiporter MnhD subunit